MRSDANSLRGDATIVLLNSLGGDDLAWDFLGLPSARPYTYPGHGNRPRVPGWNHEGAADEIVEMVEGPLVLVGVALGALVALQGLVRHPDRVQSAVIACGGSVRDDDSRLTALRKVAIGRGASAERSGMSAVVDETLARWFTPHAIAAEHPGVEYARRTLLAMDPCAWSDVWLSLVNSSYITAADAQGILAPVTLIGADQDKSSGLGGVSVLNDLIPVSRLEVVAGPHMLHLERPQIMRSLIEDHVLWAHRRQSPAVGNETAE